MHAEWGRDVQFVNILIRQGHPGPRVPPYRTFDQKRRDAIAHQREDGIPWPVLTDDLDGSTHRAYGMLADPTYLVAIDGRVSFYNTITHAPTLHRALGMLREQKWRGVAGAGYDRRPHLLSTLIAGWPALRRGLPQSIVDLETSAPGSAVAPFILYPLRDLLAPVALRSRPLSPIARATLVIGAVAALMMVTRRQPLTLNRSSSYEL